MRNILLCVALLVGFANSALAQEKMLAGTSASFIPPEGFTELTSEEIVLKYPGKSPPKFVIGNERRSTSIAYDYRDVPLEDAELPEVLASLEQGMQAAVPGLQWIEKKIISLQGQRWIYLEMTSKAVDTDIHNIMLMTSYNGKLLAINFNSTIGEFPKVEESLRKSIESIKLKRDLTTQSR